MPRDHQRAVQVVACWSGVTHCPPSAPVRLGLLNKGGFPAHPDHQGARMKRKSGPGKEPAEMVVQDIRRATRRHHSGGEKPVSSLKARIGERYWGRRSGQLVHVIGPSLHHLRHSVRYSAPWQAARILFCSLCAGCRAVTSGKAELAQDRRDRGPKAVGRRAAVISAPIPGVRDRVVRRSCRRPFDHLTGAAPRRS